MNKKTFHKLSILTAVLFMGMTSAVEPVRVFADQNVSQDEAGSKQKVKDLQDKIKTFANSMNEYADTLISSPDLMLGALGDGEVRKKLQRDFIVAKKNANYWRNELKNMLLDTNQAIINYDKEFQTYHQELINAAEKKDKSMLKEKLIALQASIKQNQEKEQQLANALKQFKERIGTDMRELINDIDDFSKTYSEKDRQLLIFILNQLKDQYSKEEFEAMLRQFDMLFSCKKLFPTAFESFSNAIDAMSETVFDWNKMDAMYNGLLENINDASTVNLNFVILELNAAKENWNVMKEAAEILNVEFKKLR